MKSEMIQEYHCDDYHLVVLIHGEDKPELHPWWYLPLGVLCLGSAALIGCVWWFGL